MKLRWTMLLALVFGLLLVHVARAESAVQIEVSFLLGYLEKSGCEFYRNGTWYDSIAARAHLYDKYQYLLARNLINTTEDFIEKAATKSSLSGQPYQVRCQGGAVMTSKQWLGDALANFRTHQ